MSCWPQRHAPVTTETLVSGSVDVEPEAIETVEDEPETSEGVEPEPEAQPSDLNPDNAVLPEFEFRLLEPEVSIIEPEQQQAGFDLIVQFENDWLLCTSEIETCNPDEVFPETAAFGSLETNIEAFNRRKDENTFTRVVSLPGETMTLVQGLAIDVSEVPGIEQPNGMILYTCYRDDGIQIELLEAASGEFVENIVNDDVLVEVKEYVVAGEDLGSLKVYFDELAEVEDTSRCDGLS